jgi:hypothetical protein
VVELAREKERERKMIRDGEEPSTSYTPSPPFPVAMVVKADIRGFDQVFWWIQVRDAKNVIVWKSSINSIKFVYPFHVALVCG